MKELKKRFKNVILMLTIGVISLGVISCNDDDETTPKQFDNPGLTVTTTELSLDAGGTLEIEVAVSIPGGYASEEALVAAGDGSVSVTQTLSEGDTSGVVTLTYTTSTPGQANISLTVTDGQAEPKTVSTTFQVTAFAPLAQEYSTLMAMVNSRPEFSELATLIAKAGATETYLVTGTEGSRYETFLAFENGALDELFAVSPFLNSIDDVDEQLAVTLLDMFRSTRMRYRGIATPFGGEYRALSLAELQEGHTMNNDAGEATSINNAGRMNNNTYGNTSFSTTKAGYFVSNSAELFADFTANDIKVNVVDGKAGIMVHVIDKAWFDFSVLSNFPSGIEEINPSMLRNQFVPRIFGWSQTSWWSLNALNSMGNFSGSRSNNGILFVPLDAVTAINSKLQTTNLSSTSESGQLIWGWPAGPLDPADPTCSSCPDWYPRPDCGCYIPEADYAIGQEYWSKHSVQMTDATALQNGAIGGSFTNITGDNVTIDLTAGTVTLGGVTANVVATIEWGDPTGDYLPLESDNQAFVDAVAAQGVVYRVVHVIDKSLY